MNRNEAELTSGRKNCRIEHLRRNMLMRSEMCGICGINSEDITECLSLSRKCWETIGSNMKQWELLGTAPFSQEIFFPIFLDVSTFASLPFTSCFGNRNTK